MRPIYIFMQNRPHFGAQILHVNPLHALRTHFPKHHLTIIGKYPASRLPLELGLVDEWQPQTGFWRRVLRERPEIVVSFARRNHLPIALGGLVGARIIAYRDRYLSFLQAHDLEYTESIYRGINYRNLLETYQIPVNDFPREPAGGSVDQIYFMPGASGGSEGSLRGIKKWGADNYYQIFLALRQRYPQYEYSFVLGPKEATEMEWLQRQTVVPGILYNPDVKSLFEKIRRARLVLANDCGPAHVAHALQKDMVQLFFGPNPEWFLPRRGAVKIIGEGNDIQTISVDKVLESALDLLSRDNNRGI